MHKIRNVPTLLPKSIREIIPNNAPTQKSAHENCALWLEIYENAGPYYRTSVFHEGPLVAISPDSESKFDPACLASINIYKNSVKKYLLSLQSQVEDDEWPVLITRITMVLYK